MTRRVLTLFLFPILLAGAGVLLLPGPGGEAAPAPTPDRLCLTCHKGQELGTAPHAVLAKTMPNATCVVCHGEVDGHLDDPWQNPVSKNDSAAEKAGRCLSCHVSGPDHVVAWADSKFAKEGMTCADCHTVHGATGPGLKFEGNEAGYAGNGTCRMCHRPVFADFGETFHAGVLDQPGGGCEACHGAGAQHANSALAYVRGEGELAMPAEPDAANCLLCHRAIPDRHARNMPVYAEKRPACTVCHDVHVNRESPLFADEGETGFAGERAGNEACATCHVSSIESMKASVHAGVAAEKGCEECHGPALAHVKSGGRPRFVANPLDESPEKASGLCLNCHAGPEAPAHAREWSGGPLAAAGLSCLTCHEAHGAADAQGKPKMAAGTEVVAGRNVGSGTCAICHSDPHPGIERSPHAALVADPDAAGCESCHGPGSAHVMKGGDPAAILNPASMPKAERATFCLRCHGKNEEMTRWDRGAHADAGLSCDTCHEPLKPVEAASKKAAPELCFACHGEVKAAFSLPNHHPLDRGAVACSDCHEVHGEGAGILDVVERKQRCFTCHKDKEGPFLYEHEADRTDGCTACHQPHGSVNRRLLTHRNTRDLCLQCHVPPPSHSMSAGSPFLNCLSCHGSIHGSYADKRFFR